MYGEFEITVEIETLVVDGKFPGSSLTKVLEWCALHKEELIEDWNLACQKRPLKKIEPLE